MAVSTLLYAGKSSSLRNAEVNKKTEAEMRVLRMVKWCSRLDMLRNESELSSLVDKIGERKNR